VAGHLNCRDAKCNRRAHPLLGAACHAVHWSSRAARGPYVRPRPRRSAVSNKDNAVRQCAAPDYPPRPGHSRRDKRHRCVRIFPVQLADVLPSRSPGWDSNPAWRDSSPARRCHVAWRRSDAWRRPALPDQPVLRSETGPSVFPDSASAARQDSELRHPSSPRPSVHDRCRRERRDDFPPRAKAPPARLRKKPRPAWPQETDS